MALPLVCGDRGEDVRDLHRRLAAAGFGDPRAEDPGHFTEQTALAVASFQRSRGLEVSGVCDTATWQMIVEAGYHLGDRLLYLHAPMLRGEDVAELQLRLGSLGFDAGRVDGIFGPDTERALAEFQRNAGLPTDGIAGQATIAELRRLGAMTNRLDPVAVVRERERLRRASRELDGRKIALGELGELSALVAATARILRRAGGRVLTLHQLDGSTQAAAANHFEAELFVAIGTTQEPACTLAYFATTGFESSGGRRLAEACSTRLPELLDVPEAVVGGMRLPILRETRMPALFCRIGPPELVVARTAALAAALAEACAAWVSSPLEP
jgi:N-acetylmuramoyl-L-alanine amidase